MEKGFGIKKFSAFAILSFILLVPMSFAIAGNQPPSGLGTKGPAVIADMYFTTVAFTGQGRCQGSPVDIIINTKVTEDLFNDVNKENLLDVYLAFPEILLLQDGVFADDCVPEDAIGMIVQAVPQFDEGDGTYKTARLILLFAVPKK